MGTRKTPEQLIADYSAKIARAKEQARKARTRRLIQAGAYFEFFLAEWEQLPEADKRQLASGVATAVRNRLNKPPA